MIKQFIKNTKLIAVKSLNLINPLISKTDTILFFNNNYEFNDNNKALLRLLVDLGFDKKYRIIYCSKDSTKYSMQYPTVDFRNTFYAPFYFLQAKFCFYDTGTLKISPTNKQQVISLWHGIPLKKIGAQLNEKSSLLDTYNDFTKILVPHPSLVNIYKASFECTDEQILINGFPRNDFLFSPSSLATNKLNINLENYDLNLLWMPTFRDSIGGRYRDSVKFKQDWDLPLFDSEKELKQLDNYLAETNSSLTIKVHPYSILNEYKLNKTYTNIKFIKNTDLNRLNIINYEFVSAFDALITDYSSILFDYLLLDKPIGFTLDDIESYKSNRGFSFSNPEDLLVGNKIYDKKEFYKFIDDIISGKDTFKSTRKDLKNSVHKFQDSHSTKRLIKYLNL